MHIFSSIIMQILPCLWLWMSFGSSYLASSPKMIFEGFCLQCSELTSLSSSAVGRWAHCCQLLLATIVDTHAWIQPSFLLIWGWMQSLANAKQGLWCWAVSSLLKIRSHYVAGAGLALESSCLRLSGIGIMGVCQHAWQEVQIFY